MTFVADDGGTLTETINLEEKTIKIACNWQMNISDKPSEGYLANSLMEYGFLACSQCFFHSHDLNNLRSVLLWNSLLSYLISSYQPCLSHLIK